MESRDPTGATPREPWVATWGKGPTVQADFFLETEGRGSLGTIRFLRAGSGKLSSV